MRRVKQRVYTIIFWSILGLNLKTGLFAGAEEEKVTLTRHFAALGKDFGTKSKEKAKILSGPTPVLMLNDKSPGRAWQVSLGDVTFKVTIQDKVEMRAEEVLERLEKVPPAYRHMFRIVSEGEKAGVAFCADLSGAAAHGSQDYLNMVPNANAFVIVHEAGHILEQRTTSSKPETLNKWKEAIAKDKISVSAYGDGVAHEDLAEFAYIYAMCLDAGETQLGELKTLSPQRSLLWEDILQISKSSPAKRADAVTTEFYNETYRPQFHFTPKINWTNDPNGLVYYSGEYHLFFQHNPTGINWGNMTWGHAVSKDLVHWTQVDNAIDPDKLGTIFSGSAVVDWENTSGFGTADAKALVCIYTAAGGQSPESTGRPFTQCIAYSTDGRKFIKYDKNPVLGHIVGGNRDPKVIWYAPEKKWIMALFLDGDTYALFESKDLKSWTKLHDVKFPGHGECPDFFPMPVDGNKKNQKWVFTAANGDYLIGSFDGKTFNPESDVIRADYGANYYAVQTYSDVPASDGRRIQIAWMNGGKYPDMPFNQQMSFPCEMSVRTFPEGFRICRLPVREIESIYGKKHTWKDKTVKPGENLLKDVTGGLYDIQLQVDLAGAKEFGIKCRGEAVTYSAEKRMLTCLGKDAPIDAANGRITLRILLDRTCMEVFANDGKVVMTSCVLPNPENAGLELFSDGDSPKILSMTLYELKSAWVQSREDSPGSSVKE